MFDFRRKDQFEFGSVSPDDDRDIEVVQLRRESRQGIWTESLRLIRDIFLIIVVFILFGVFAGWCRARAAVRGSPCGAWAG